MNEADRTAVRRRVVTVLTESEARAVFDVLGNAEGLTKPEKRDRYQWQPFEMRAAGRAHTKLRRALGDEQGSGTVTLSQNSRKRLACLERRAARLEERYAKDPKAVRALEEANALRWAADMVTGLLLADD